MNERQQKLLTFVIKEHIKTAQAVGSELIVDKYNLGVSSATVRNDMATLEEQGYLTHLHTSAGRVPTEKGYRFYVDNLLSAKEPNDAVQKVFQEVTRRSKNDAQLLVRSLAKAIAEVSGESVFVGFGQYDVYYTGISNIFAKPEFAEQAMIYDISRVVDHLDEVMAKVFYMEKKEAPQILIGSNNPFGEICSSVLADYKIEKNHGLIGILGPMRMDYDSNLGLINFTKNLINSI